VADRSEFGPMDFRRIAYSAHGKGRMTVKLGLWFLHMIASAPLRDSSVGPTYTSLHGYVKVKTGGFRHLSTGLKKSTAPKDAPVYDCLPRADGMNDISLDERDEVVSQASQLFCEDIRKVKWVKEERQWLLKTFQRGSQYYMPGTPRLRSKKDGRWYLLRHKGADEYDWDLDK
jgi:hypothetical protein